jgi:signal transduction histidine kinase
VEDNGAGIHPEILPHIFDPFFSTKEEQMRTGLGLAVAHSIVEQHGGRLIASSSPRKSTKLTLTLPRYDPARKAQGLTAA